MRELIEAYRQFPKWIVEYIFNNTKYVELIEFDNLYGVNPYMFQFNYHDMKIRVKLDFNRFKDIYYQEGNESKEDTYFILANKLYEQFLNEIQRDFVKELKRGNINYE